MTNKISRYKTLSIMESLQNTPKLRESVKFGSSSKLFIFVKPVRVCIFHFLILDSVHFRELFLRLPLAVLKSTSPSSVFLLFILFLSGCKTKDKEWIDESEDLCEIDV